MTEQLPRNLSSFDTVCEQTANLLNTGKQRVAGLIRRAIEDVMEINYNNIHWNMRHESGNEVIVLIEDKRSEQTQAIRLSLKILLPRGGAAGGLKEKRLLKITRQTDGDSEVVARELV